MAEHLAGRYRSLDTLGEGAMGKVWLVEDELKGEQLALKAISTKIGASEGTVLQFKQEFRLMSRLRHPNCCEVKDFGLLDGGEPYFTMEAVPGHGLDELLPLEARHFMPVMSQLLLALDHVHREGLVHKDVKGMNVRLRPDGMVKLMDFGLMDFAGREGAPISGTVPYLAPEIILRGTVDGRADLYAVGVLAYEMLSGVQPFSSPKPTEVLRAHLGEKPVPPSAHKPGIDPGWERVVLRLLAKQPYERYASARAVLEALGVAGGAEGPVAPARLLTATLAGRDAELATIDRHSALVAASRPGEALFVVGPAGIGKSRLLREATTRLQLDEVLVAHGQAEERDRTPYAPFSAVLHQLLGEARARAPQTLERLAPVLVALLGELGVQRAPVLEGPNQEKTRLHAAVGELLTTLAQHRPLALVLDAWQWADGPSKELLAHLLRATAAAPILFLVAGREPPDSSAFVELALGGLDARALTRLVGSMLEGDMVAEAFVGQLLETTRGNPGAVEGLLERLVAAGVLGKQGESWQTDIELPPALALPAGEPAVIAALPEPVRELARAAAVVGPSFELGLLLHVMGWGDEQLLEAVESLARAQVVVRESKGYRFARAGLRDAIYDALEPEAKARWHAAIARALERGAQGQPATTQTTAHVRAIASHSAAGHQRDATIVYALEAGLRSMEFFALDDAERFLGEGLAELRAAHDPRWREQERAYLAALADLSRLAGRREAARSLNLEALTVATELGDTAWLARLLTSQAKLLQELDDLPGALAAVDRAGELAAAGGHDAVLARCLLTRARIRFFRGSAAAAHSDTDQALAAARRASDYAHIAEALAFKGYLEVAGDGGQTQLGIRSLRESVEMLEDSGDRIGINNSLMILGDALVMADDFQGARQAFRRALALCEEVGYHSERTFALLNLAIVALELGEHAEAAELAELAMEGAKDRYASGMALAISSAARAHAGEPAARDGLALALATARSLDHRYMEMQVLGYVLEAEVQQGRHGEAIALGLELRGLIAQTGNKEPEKRVEVLLGLAYAQAGERALAVAALEHAESRARAAGARSILARAHRARALLALAAGDQLLARREVELALASAKELGLAREVKACQEVLGGLGIRAPQQRPGMPGGMWGM